MKRILTTLKEKWPEYLLEVLVITFGILGAFSLNAWKENSDIKDQVRKSLINMIAELEADSIQFSFQKTGSERTLANIRKVLDLLKSTSNNYPDSLESYYHGSRGFILYVPQKSAFESMNQLGLLANISDVDLLYQIQNYYTFTQPNVKIVRDFEEGKFQEKMNSINTNSAIIMEEASWEDLPLDYQKVKTILSRPENFRKIYDYGKTQEFLIGRSIGYIQSNQELLAALRNHLDD